MAKKRKTFKVGRNASTGRFATVKRARSTPSRYVVETMRTRTKKKR
jgi:hypothetical protein